MFGRLNDEMRLREKLLLNQCLAIKSGIAIGFDVEMKGYKILNRRTGSIRPAIGATSRA